MGQVTVDLPDPITSPPPGKAAGADDLLAKMAGEEIDRLLAEAEAENIPTEDPQAAAEATLASAFLSPAVATETPVSTKGSTDEVLADELDSLLKTLTTAREPAPDVQLPPSWSSAAAESERRAVSDAVIGISSTESAALMSETEDVGAAGRTVVENASSSEASARLVEETSAAERQALNAAPEVEPVVAKAMDKAVAAAAEAVVVEPEPLSPEDAPLPLLLRPLEWLNAPFAAAPDLLREFIGKAAILTVVNAVAVIVYVHFIRRH